MYEITEKSLTLRRKSVIYLHHFSQEDLKFQPKNLLLSEAKKNGKKMSCVIEFQIERHDDRLPVRERLKEFKRIREQLEILREHFSKRAGGLESDEYQKTRKILIQKLRPAPMYRILQIYLYPQKNQCVTPEEDWFVENQFRGTSAYMPAETDEEIRLILKNLDQIRLTD